jgi:hypothetical protein
MFIPLTTPRGVYGCLQLNDSSTGFSENDKTLCQNVAAMMALDIEDKGFAEFHKACLRIHEYGKPKRFNHLGDHLLFKRSG